MRYAKDFNGSIKIYSSIPKKWEDDIAFSMRDKQYLNDKGFFEVVEVTPSATHKLGAIYFDAVNKVFTYPLINKTQAELDQEAEQALNSDVSQQAIDQRRADGMQGFDRIKAIIERKYRNGEITATQAKNADAYFHALIKDLNFGSWIIVKGLLATEAPNVPAGYQALFDTIKGKVDNYVTNNY